MDKQLGSHHQGQSQGQQQGGYQWGQGLGVGFGSGFHDTRQVSSAPSQSLTMLMLLQLCCNEMVILLLDTVCRLSLGGLLLCSVCS